MFRHLSNHQTQVLNIFVRLFIYRINIIFDCIFIIQISVIIENLPINLILNKKRHQLKII